MWGLEGGEGIGARRQGSQARPGTEGGPRQDLQEPGAAEVGLLEEVQGNAADPVVLVVLLLVERGLEVEVLLVVDAVREVALVPPPHRLPVEVLAVDLPRVMAVHAHCGGGGTAGRPPARLRRHATTARQRRRTGGGGLFAKRH